MNAFNPCSTEDCDRYLALLNNPLVPVMMLRPDETVVYANLTACNMMGVTFPLSGNLDLKNGLPDTEYEVLKESLILAYQQGEPIQLEISGFSDQPGIRVAIEPVKQNGEVKELILVFSGFSKKDSDIQLPDEKDKLLEILFDDRALGMVYGSPSGELLKVNRKYCEMLGFRSEEIVGHRFSEFTHPDDREREKSYLRQLFDGKDDKVSYEKRYLRKGGEVVWGEIFARAVRYIDGALQYVIVTVRDMSLVHAISETLQDNELKFQALFKSIPDPVFIADRQTGKIMEVNDRVLEIYGYSREEILNLRVSDFATEPGLAMRAMQENVPLVPLRYHKKKSGDIFPVEITNAASKIGDQEIIIGTARDITLRLLTENELRLARTKAEESDRLKSAFLANMSHEIRTPMNGIVGFANMLKKSGLKDETIHYYADIIIKSSEQLLNLVNDLLDISRIETGQIEFRKSIIRLNKLLDELHDFFKPKANEKGLLLITEKPQDGVNDLVEVDETRLRQIFINLISNALKFTPRGHVTFGWRKNGQDLECFVKDSGIGIPEEQQSMIFDRFWQGQPDIAGRFGGAGLGLAICKGITEKMGGKFTISSKKDAGSLFQLTVPAPFVSVTPQKEKSVKETERKPEFAGETILVAEDEEFNYIFLYELLSRKGLKLLRASNGLEAVEMIDKHPEVSLILMDIKMPVMNGLEATKTIKQSHPAIRIIAQTAYAHLAERDQIVSAGCDDYISKPINIPELMRILSVHLHAATEN